VRPGREYGRLVKRWLRRHGLDLMIVVAAAAAVMEAFLRSDDAHAPSTAPLLAAAAALLVILPLLGRRRWPFLAPAWLWLVAAALSFLDGRLIVSSASVYATGLVAAFLIGSLHDERQGRIGLAIIAGSGAIIALNDPLHELSEVLLVPAIFTLAWLGGFAQRERAAQALDAEERARHAEAQRETAARLAVAEERARIAREVHDTVAHAVSVMVLQVGAVRHRLPDDFAEDVEALRGVEATGRSALGEMRHLVGAMRRGDDGPELAPQPGLARLEVLLQEIRRAGLPVELQVDGEPVGLPAAIDLSAYRIVQEALTNALKHAHAGQARVEIGYTADALRIEVSDDGDGATDDAGGNGHGLVGIRERVKLYGGELSSGPAPGGGFRLTTSLPLSGYGS
jgi:signal transduction histidine kinase